MKPKRKYGKLVLITLLLIVVAVIYFVCNPASITIFPKCAFFQLTGLQCPGCGSQRDIHQLLHGNLVEAMHYNAFLVMCIPWLLTILAAHFSKTERKERLNRIFLHKNVVNMYLILFFCWWIYRIVV